MAVKYVLKRTIVLKKDAHKFAFLALVIPLVFGVLTIGNGASNMEDLMANISGTVLTFGFIYYSVTSLIQKHGD